MEVLALTFNDKRFIVLDESVSLLETLNHDFESSRRDAPAALTPANQNDRSPVESLAAVRPPLNRQPQVRHGILMSLGYLIGAHEGPLSITRRTRS